MRRPDLASQLQVVDELLSTLATGELPERHDLVVLMVGYWDHPDFERAWTAYLE